MFRLPHSFLAVALLSCPLPVWADLVISEFSASNKAGVFDGLGNASDWIELHNPTPVGVALNGWKLRDSSTTWPLPDITLPAGGYLLVFASDHTEQPFMDPAGYWHANFKLDSAGEPLTLLRPDHSIAQAYTSPIPPQKEDVSFGMVQETTALVTFGSAANILAPTAAVSDTWWSNPSFLTTGWTTGKAAAGFGNPFPNYGGTVAYRVATGTVGNQDFSGSIGMDFYVDETIQVTELGCFDSGGNGISSTITVQLWRRNENGTPTNFADDTGLTNLGYAIFVPSSSGTLLEGSRFKTPAPLGLPILLAPGAYSIIANGFGASDPIGNSLDAWETNSGNGKIRFVGGGRYGVANTFPTTADGGPANRYAAGTFKFGAVSDPIVRTSLQGSMLNQRPSALMRIPFTVADPSVFDALRLRLPYDDGCVVWLNGVEVARRNAPAVPAYNSTATQLGNAIETIALSSASLVPGTNLLAIQGLNRTNADADFFIGAELTGTKIHPEIVRYFPNSTPNGPNPATGLLGYVADTKFSLERGFYDTPQTVAITCATPGATIRYTLDGSPPGPSIGNIYTAPLEISTTTILRATASAPGLQPTNIDTNTYLFANDVAIQSSTAPPSYPANTWTDFTNNVTVTADYGMVNFGSDFANYAKAAGNAAYTPEQARAAVANSIKGLPVLSITTDKANLFDPVTGIYLHPAARGEAWERGCSVELITADESEGFQVDGGIHVMGNSSRNLGTTPKLNFMLVFGDQYGPKWLNEDFFGPGASGRFKRIALRSNTRDGWVAEGYGPGTATYLVDGWSKQSQIDSGHAGTHGRYCHLFLNGLYWGVYNPTERPESHWAETTYGGENEDYDVIDLCCNNHLESGDMVEWNDLLAKSAALFNTDAKYQAVQGNNSNGTPNPALKKLLGVDSFINFALNGYYTAGGDWPGNFFVAYDNVQTRTPGWQFITWDNDLSFQGFTVGVNKVTPAEGFSHPFWLNSPGQVDVGLRAHPEYRMRLADTTFRYFFHNGPYTTANNQERWNALKIAIQPGLYAESARWGDYSGLPIRTVQDSWLPRVTTVASNFFSQRNAILISQLRAAGLYPSIDPPEYNPHGGTVGNGFGLRMSASAGTIYFTINGADPRMPGGAVAASAQTVVNGGFAATLTQTSVVRSRARTATEWSALNEVTFVVGNAAQAGELRLTELHYHPSNPNSAESLAGFTVDSQFEFLELTNVTNQPLDLTGCHFTDGIEFTFTGSAVTLLQPGASVLVVANSAAFQVRYGAALAPKIAGIFANGSNLRDSGETITLVDNNGVIIFSVSYGDRAPWPSNADGSGSSLVLQGTDEANSANWRSSLGPAQPGANLDIKSEWLRLYFSTQEQSDPFVCGDLADPDSDGISNLVELVSNSDPRHGDSGHDALTAAVQTLLVDEVYDEYFTLEFRSLTSLGYTTSLQKSTDLMTWIDAIPSLVLHSTDNLGTGWKTATYRSPGPFSGIAPGKIYYRLKVSKP